MYLELFQFLFILPTPLQSFLHSLIPQTLSDAVHVQKGIGIDQFFNAFFPCQRHRALRIPISQQVVDHEPVESLATPTLVTNIIQTVHRVELGHVCKAVQRHLLQTGFLCRRGSQFPLQSAHLGQHGVDIGEHLVRRGRLQSQTETDCRALLLQVQMGRSDILAQKLVGQAQKRLILQRVSADLLPKLER